MPTNQKRKIRTSRNRIPSNVNAEYILDLQCREYLDDPLNEEEKKLANELRQCGWDFEKWKQFKEGKK